MRYFVTIGSASHEIEVGGESPYRVVHCDAPSESLRAEVYGSHGCYRVYLGGKVIDLVLDGGRIELNGRTISATIRSERDGEASSKKKLANGTTRAFTAQMPGRVLQVRVKAGDRVTIGSPLLVIEAMKMENELIADADAVVEKVLVQPGDAVEAGAPLLLLAWPPA